MKRRLVSTLLALLLLFIIPAQASAAERAIVRTESSLLLSGSTIVKSACSLVGCQLLYGIDGTLGRLFLVLIPDPLDPEAVVATLATLPGILDAELDQIVRTTGADGDSAPPALLDDEPLGYYGVTVRAGYVRQPAEMILGITKAHSKYGVTGKGITVAVIDTGVDPSHPVLKPILLTGYDFTRNRDGGSERSDVDQSTMAVLDGAEPGWVNQSTMAVLDQSTMAVLDDPEHAAFGHGTMVAGVIHLTAPRAKILPLKAFRSDGSGYASDVLRAIYVAVNAGAKVINMSFSFSTFSRELERTMSYATSKGVIGVGSAGNDGQRIDVYPASLSTVIGVASSTDWDTLSDFSNFGPNVAWITAPGEAIVSTYPFGTYAAAWGTSFSAPFAAGTAALLAEVSKKVSSTQAADAEGKYTVWLSSEVSKGRMYVPAAVRAWREKLGLK